MHPEADGLDDRGALGIGQEHPFIMLDANPRVSCPISGPWPIVLSALPERWVTVHSGEIGLHTEPFARSAKVPWKECNRMDERLKFIAGLLDDRRRLS